MTTIETQVNNILVAAVDDDALRNLAICDGIEAYIRAATHRRTARETIEMLSHWTRVFEKLERRP